MHERHRVLVVGTTSDYVDWIRTACPGRGVFVTAQEIRLQAREPVPAADEEILCDLTDSRKVFDALAAHFDSFEIRPVGIACFDCESMPLAAALAERLGLSYPSAGAIERCRNKYLSKTVWQRNGVACPAFRLVRAAGDVSAFYETIPGACILKPISGSGSELVYVCNSLRECESNFQIVREELGRRENNRLYSSGDTDFPGMMAEEYVEGEEYSCDFLLDDNRVDIVRITRKIKASDKPVGTVLAYVFPASLPEYLTHVLLPEALKDGARALGLGRCLCMADFILRGERIVFIEMTPRPGGDCLPFLLRKASGMDILAMAVDFAEGKPLNPPDTTALQPHIGMRIHAEKAGVLGRIETKDALDDPRVLEGHFPRSPGHRIVMPPSDYDSWLLGHVIFRSEPGADPEAECGTIRGKIGIEIGD